MGSLTSIQHAVLVGSLLGDGSLRKQGSRTNALLEINHSWRAKEYVDWKYHIFQQFVLSPPKRRRGNGQRVAYRFTTRSLPIFTRYHHWFYQSGKKQVPADLRLDSLALAVWFMDDGSASRSACYLNTQQFALSEQRVLQEILQRNFAIVSTLNRDKDYHRLRITTESTQELHRLIVPYVLPMFRYKLGNDPVTTDPKGEALALARLRQDADTC